MFALRTVLIGFVTTIVSAFTLENMLGLFIATTAMVPLTMVSMSLIVIVGVLKLISNLMSEDVSTNMLNLGSLLNGFINAITNSISLKTALKLGLAMPAIVMIGAAALAISGVAKTIQLLSSLKVPTKFDKDGNPIEFEVMTTQHFEDAKKNIMTICTAFSSALTSPEMVEFLNTEYKNGEENMKLLGAMGNAVGGMVQGVVSLAEGRVAKFSEDGKEIVGYDSIGDILNDVNKQNELKRNLSNLLGIYISAVTSSDV